MGYTPHVSMTKMHFQLIAETLRACAAPARIVRAFVDRLKETNSQFDKSRFVEAATAAPAVAEAVTRRAGESHESPFNRAQVVKLNAGNDRNGNPRRLYLLLVGSAIVRAYDEGYSGAGAVREEVRSMARMADLWEIRTTPAEYRRLLRLHGDGSAR